VLPTCARRGSGTETNSFPPLSYGHLVSWISPRVHSHEAQSQQRDQPHIPGNWEPRLEPGVDRSGCWGENRARAAQPLELGSEVPLLIHPGTGPGTAQRPVSPWPPGPGEAPACWPLWFGGRRWSGAPLDTGCFAWNRLAGTSCSVCLGAGLAGFWAYWTWRALRHATSALEPRLEQIAVARKMRAGTGGKSWRAAGRWTGWTGCKALYRVSPLADRLAQVWQSNWISAQCSGVTRRLNQQFYQELDIQARRA